MGGWSRGLCGRKEEGQESQRQPLLCQPPVLCSLPIGVMTTGTWLLVGGKNFGIGWGVALLHLFRCHGSLSPCPSPPLQLSWWFGFNKAGACSQPHLCYNEIVCPIQVPGPLSVLEVYPSLKQYKKYKDFLTKLTICKHLLFILNYVLPFWSICVRKREKNYSFFKKEYIFFY